MAVVLPMWGQLPPLVELDKGKASYYRWAQKACHVINKKACQVVGPNEIAI